MKKAMVIWNEENKRWDLLLKDELEGDLPENTSVWTWSKGWLVKDEDPRSGCAWVFDDILCQIAQLQRDGWTVEVRV